MYCFVFKLKMIKEKIFKWNKRQFNKIFKKKKKTEEYLNKLNEEVIKNGMDNEKCFREKDLLAKQEEILAKEEIF